LISVCKNCNKERETKVKANFCSSNCNHLYKYRKSREAINFSKICQECNSSFDAQKVSTKYCSAKCNNSAWFRNNRAKHNFKEARRRALKLKATPKWLTQQHWAEIRRFYEECPDGHHVDHIHPLVSDIVCGLHVPWNLQWLPAKENILKSNKVEQ
jgi:hypothetical protein